MSIKTYLRTLLESVFTSKKEWIGEQAGFSLSGEVGLALSASQEYTPPSDGYFSVRGHKDATNGSVWFVGNNSRWEEKASESGSYCGLWLPVKKGATVSYHSMKVVIEECKFFPIKGAV